MSELTLYADAKWESPWVFHAMVALEELRQPYKLVPLRIPFPDEIKAELRARALLPKIPCLVDGELWLTESAAISEYLAERFPPPTHARLLPASLADRARARQVLSWLRTSLNALREERPTTSVFMRPVQKPLSEKARRDADELIRIAEQLISADRKSLAAEWCIADVDLALALMRLIANSDPVPQRLVDYALAQWSRTSVLKFLSYIPTTH